MAHEQTQILGFGQRANLQAYRIVYAYIHPVAVIFGREYVEPAISKGTLLLHPTAPVTDFTVDPFGVTGPAHLPVRDKATPPVPIPTHLPNPLRQPTRHPPHAHR